MREFRLSPVGSGRGISCDASGAFIGSLPLLKRIRRLGEEFWVPRDCAELSKEIGVVWNLPVEFASRAGGLNAIANALNDGDIARAQIATVLLAIPEPPARIEGINAHIVLTKFICDLYRGELIKADWDPDEHPRWPSGAPDSQGGQFAPKGESSATGDASGDPVPDRSIPSRSAQTSNEIRIDDGVYRPNDNRGNQGHFDDGVYRPDSDPAELEGAGDPRQLLLNRLTHDAQVLREMEQWRRKGFVPIPNVMFEDPRNGTPIVADYVVSMWVPDPMSFFLFPKLEPILVRDVKTGGGGLSDNQKQVYPYILRGGAVIPVGDNAAWAGFEVGEPTVIAEMYVGHDLPADTIH